MKKFLKWTFIIFFVIPTIIIFISVILDDNSDTPEKINELTVVDSKQSEAKEKENQKINESAKIEIKSLNYSALGLKKVGLSSQNRATQKIILEVDELPNEELLKETAIKHWKKNKYSKFDEFTVFIYLPEMNTNDNAYGIVEFNNKGNITYFLIKESSIYDTKWEN